MPITKGTDNKRTPRVNLTIFSELLWLVSNNFIGFYFKINKYIDIEKDKYLIY